MVAFVFVTAMAKAQDALLAGATVGSGYSTGQASSEVGRVNVSGPVVSGGVMLGVALPKWAFAGEFETGRLAGSESATLYSFSGVVLYRDGPPGLTGSVAAGYGAALFDDQDAPASNRASPHYDKLEQGPRIAVRVAYGWKIVSVGVTGSFAYLMGAETTYTPVTVLANVAVSSW